MIDQLGEAAETVEAALHGLLVEHALIVYAGRQLDLLAQPLEDAHLSIAGARQYHMEAVRAQIEGGDQR